MNELAIASVPIQPWEQPFDPPKALCSGSLFGSLHKPFFIEEQMEPGPAKPQDECEAMLRQIQQVTFCLIDISLFLHTHPEQQEAVQLKATYQTARKELLKQFAEKYYPLTSDCAGPETEGRIPWEGGSEYVVV